MTWNATAFDPHPAIRALSPQATMGDGWMGDDFFHQGAFRLSYGVEYAWDDGSELDRASSRPPRDTTRTNGTARLRRSPTSANAIGASAWPTWRDFVEHPTYDAEWQARAMPLHLRAPRSRR